MNISNNVLVVPEELHVVLEFLVFVLREIDHLGDLGIDARMILRWISRKWDGGSGKWTGSTWLRTWAGGRHL